MMSMDEAARIRDDEFAEMELRILVALYDAWPEPRDVRLGEVYRPAGRYTGPNDAPAVLEGLLAGRVEGRLGPTGLLAGKLDGSTRACLAGTGAAGVPRIEKARAVIAEASRPTLGRATAVRDEIRG